LVIFLISGQEQHVGTKAPPRELQLENAVMPPDPGFIRVQVKNLISKSLQISKRLICYTVRVKI